MRRTKEEAEQTKQDILEAALDVFDEKSYDTATLSNIAKKAGVTRGAIYWHFENKFDILRELMEKYFGEFLNDVYSEMNERNESSIASIVILFDSYAKNILNNPDTLKFRRVLEHKISFTENTEQIESLFGTFKKNMLDTLLKLIKEGQEKKEIREDMTADFLALSLISWIVGYESICLMTVSHLEVEKDANVIVENIIKFIKA